MTQFFKNIKVLELASVLAGPGVGQFFAELGAEVIKVENLQGQGDVTRSWKAVGETTDDRSAYFCAVNWGKRSIAVDLSTSEGQQVVSRLAARADIVIASYKPGDARKLGVDYERIKELNPKVVYGQVTGYGSDNQRVGYDAVLQAESGFMFMNGEPGGNSLKMPVALVDVLAGHQLKEGVLLALLERQLSGESQFVEVSLFDAAVSSLVNQATNYLMNGKIPQKQGSAHPNIAPYGDVFTTRDGAEIILAIGSDKQFRSLCKLIGKPEIADNEMFRINSRRVGNRVQLKSVIQTVIKEFDSHELMAKFIRENIPAGIIRNLKEVFETPGTAKLLLQNNGLQGIRTYVGNSRESLPKLLPPPHFGEHTFEILQELGLA